MPEHRRAILGLDKEERGYVLGESFSTALGEIAKTGVDLVCFTGDIADWGHPEEYLAATTRIEHILKIVDVPRDRFYAVPGNHDVQRNTAEDAWKGIRDWSSRASDRSGLGRWFREVGQAPSGISADWRDSILKRTEAFWNWLDSFGRPDLRPQSLKLLGFRKTLPARTFDHIHIDVHIIGLDSAWLCGADNDQGQILVTEEQVLAHVRDGEKPLAGYRIALIHHPLDHLADHYEVRRLLAANGVDLLLHGHQHTQTVITTAEPGAQLRLLASGCLIEGEHGKNWPNGFQLIEIDVKRKTGAVHFRKWARNARYWAKGTDIYRDAPDGVLRWPPESEAPVAELSFQDAVELERASETSPIESAVHTGFRLHVDNTLIHSLVRCLEKRAKEVDVAGLLGFANFLVFADTIVFGHQELDAVRETSERLITELHMLQLEDSAVDHVTVSRENFESACRLAAARLGPQVDVSLRGMRSLKPDARVKLHPEGVEVDVLRYQRVHDLITMPAQSEKGLVELAKHAIAERRSVGAFEYAIGIDDVLRKALRKAYVARPWDVHLTEKMAILFRIHLHHVLASRQGALHAPAPGRMRLLSHLISTVSLASEDHLRHLDLLVPDIARFVVNTREGDPRRVLAAAIELRARAATIRERLRSLACDLLTEQDDESRRDFRAEARKLVAGQTERNEPDRWGLKLILLAHIANVGFGFDLQIKWWRKGPVVALSHDSTFFNADDPDFRSLIRNCGNG